MQQPTMVTGAAGFIGQNLLSVLAARDLPGVAFYHQRVPECGESVYPVQGDITSDEDLDRALRNVECVVHLAWSQGFKGPEMASLTGGSDTENLRMIRSLIKGMERAGTKRLVFMSANGAHLEAEDRFLQEKYFAESLIINSRIPEKIIIRAAPVWSGTGIRDRFVQSVMQLLKFPVYPLPKSKTPLAPLHVKDLTATLLSAITSNLVDVSAYVVSVEGGAHYQPREILKIVASEYVKKPQLPIGGFIGAYFAGLLERRGVKKLSTQSQPVAGMSNYLVMAHSELGSEKPYELSLDLVPKSRIAFQNLTAP